MRELHSQSRHRRDQLTVLPEISIPYPDFDTQAEACDYARLFIKESAKRGM
jgi:hypothetical protein